MLVDCREIGRIYPALGFLLDGHVQGNQELSVPRAIPKSQEGEKFPQSSETFLVKAERGQLAGSTCCEGPLHQLAQDPLSFSLQSIKSLFHSFQ